MPLLQLLETINKFHRAPVTEKASFPTSGSPYQPILMLSVVRMFRRGQRNTRIVMFEECKTEFGLLYEGLYGPQESTELAPKVVQPFWVFGSGRSMTPLWELVAAEGRHEELKREIETRPAPLKSESRLNELVKGAELTVEAFELLRNDVAQQAITSFTVQRYFRSPTEIVQQL